MTRTLVFLLAALVGVGAAMVVVAARAYEAFVGYRAPYPSPPRVQEAAPAVARPVVFVLIDGLRLDASRAMPFLGALRRRGADLDCRVGSPSLSLPGRGVLMTGAWAEVHGQLLNSPPRRLSLEHLFESARRSGLRTMLTASSDVHTLFSPYVDQPIVYTEASMREGRTLDEYRASLRAIGAEARQAARTTPSDLVVIELPTTDGAAHDWGGVSPGYHAVVAEADAVLRDLAEGIDLGRGVLVVTSDHGHTDAGGHGGDEPPVVDVPLVFAGRGIRPGITGRAHQIDVAPTLAAILGVPIPAASQGRLLDVLEDDGHGPARLRVVRAQRERAARSYVAALGGTWGSGAEDGAPEGVDRLMEARRAERLSAEQARRRGPALLMLVLPVFVPLAVAFRHRRYAGVAALAGGGATLAYTALRAAFGISTSLSSINREEQLVSRVATNMALAFLVCAAAAAGAVWFAARRGIAGGRGERALTATLTAAVFLFPFFVRIAGVHHRVGFVMEWALVNLHDTLGLYFDTLAVAAVGLGAPLLAAAAAFSGRGSAAAGR